MPRSVFKSKTRVAPIPVHAPFPAISPNTIRRTSGLGETMKEAIVFGVGSSVGRTLTDKVFGMFDSKSDVPIKNDECFEYKECIKESSRADCHTIYVKCAPIRDIE